MTLPVAYSRRSYSGGATLTTIPNGMGIGDLSFTLASNTNWPTTNFLVVVDRGISTEEKIWCTVQSGGVITIPVGGRGVDGSNASPHLGGATVFVCASAQDLDEANQMVAATLGTAVGGNVGYVLGITSNGATPTFSWLSPTASTFSTFNIKAKTSTYLAIASDFVQANAASGAFTVTIPVAAGGTFVVKKTDTTFANAVTITPASGTIDGQASLKLYGQYAGYMLEADGTNINVIGTIASPPQGYTPAWTSTGTQPAEGNGIFQGQFSQNGRTISLQLYVNPGSTTTFGTGGYNFSLPVTTNGVNAPGNAMVADTTIYQLTALANSTFLTLYGPTSASVTTSIRTTGTVPVSWTTSTQFYANVSYAI